MCEAGTVGVGSPQTSKNKEIHPEFSNQKEGRSEKSLPKDQRPFQKYLHQSHQSGHELHRVLEKDREDPFQSGLNFRRFQIVRILQVCQKFQEPF